MDTLELIFAIIGVVGFCFLLVSFVFGELGELLGDADAGHGAEFPVPEWYDIKVVAAGMVGLGAFGFIALQIGWPSPAAAAVSVFGFIAVGATALFGLLKPLAKQQSNSLTGRHSYADQTAKVIVPVSPERFGLVELIDINGARVRLKAQTDYGLLPAGSEVLVFQVDDDCVHVTSDPNNPVELQ